jgi:hypothetical protein
MRADGHHYCTSKLCEAMATMSAYLRPEKNVPLTPHQQFLTMLTLGFWQEYSGIAHATFQGLMATAMCYVTDKVTAEEEAQFDDAVGISIVRIAAILLCVLREVQAHCRFGGAAFTGGCMKFGTRCSKLPRSRSCTMSGIRSSWQTGESGQTGV